MSNTLKHPDGLVCVVKTTTGKHRVSVELSNPAQFMLRGECETSYPLDLIEHILDVKGPAWLCDEILRDEDPRLVQHSLKYDVLSYVSEDSLNGKSILDFGCGSGASTMILARMFPEARKVGVELEERLLSVARHRARYYGFDRVEFFLSPHGSDVPKQLGDIDYILLSAVYEHLLPEERRVLLPKIWQLLRPNGILFISQTPFRYFPLESHTTGLPLINYLPDRIVLHFARWFSKRVRPTESWANLMRQGIRGGTVGEIMGILSKTPHTPILLTPNRLGVKNQIDLWYKLSTSARFPAIKKTVMFFMQMVKFLTGITLVPYLSLAIKKET